ncbi:MAG: transmembrane 220 family protein [Chitinophagaceae bacterium]
MKMFNIFFSILFLIFAGLQYNDPDPYIWIPIYLYATIYCWLAAKNKFYPKAYLLGILVYAGYALYLFFTQDGVVDWIQKHNGENIAGTMKAETPWIEDTREFFGLVILIVVLAINFFYAKKRKTTNK